MLLIEYFCWTPCTGIIEKTKLTLLLITVNPTVNAPTHLPHYTSGPQQPPQQLYNVPNYQYQQPPCCAHCIHGGGQVQCTAGTGSLMFSSSPATSPDSGNFNQPQEFVAHGSSDCQTLGSLALNPSLRPLRLMSRNCSFCFKNGEHHCVYSSHELKNDQGIVLCPILRRYVCNICRATGDKAHTRKYCPYNTEISDNRPLLRGIATDCHLRK